MKQDDPYIRLSADVRCRPGLTPLDETKLCGGRSFIRTYEITRDQEQRTYPRDRTTILAKGLALGVDETGAVGHFWPGRKFIGFHAGQGEDQITVKIRGHVVLSLHGVNDGDIGLPVYALGPNSFSLQMGDGAEIGEVVRIEGSRAVVAFRQDRGSRKTA